jgi:hypothetical protein
MRPTLPAVRASLHESPLSLSYVAAMPGGPEWIIILVAAIVVAIVLLVIRSDRSQSATPVVDSSTIRLPGGGRAWLETVANDVHQLDAHSVEWLSADVLRVSPSTIRLGGEFSNAVVATVNARVP